MPAELVTGEDAEDVAAYVAAGGRQAGEDTGALAQVGGGPEGTAEAENGVLEIPAAPSGALYYVFADATAPAGQLKVESPNESSVDHNIALEGNGVNEEGDGRQGRRGLGGRRRPRARRVHVLLLGRGPPRGRHGGHAHGGVSSASRSRLLLAIGVLRRAVEEEAQREDHDQEVDGRPSWPPAVCWSAERAEPVPAVAGSRRRRCRSARGSARSSSRAASRPSARR